MHWYNNKCFDKNSLQGTRDAIAGDSTLLSLFSTPTGNTAVIQQIIHNTTGASIFYRRITRVIRICCSAGIIFWLRAYIR